MQSRLFGLLIALALVPAVGCALFSKVDPIEPRYYSPWGSVAENVPEPAPTLDAGDVRLRRVTAAAHLREGLVHQESRSEFRVSETHLWTEPPADYLRRALEAELFERRGLTRVFVASAPTVELALTRFDELRDQGKVRVELVVTLQHKQRAILQETLAVERAFTGSESESRAAQAAALGEALGEIVRDVADRISKSL